MIKTFAWKTAKFQLEDKEKKYALIFNDRELFEKLEKIIENYYQIKNAKLKMFFDTQI